MSSKLITYLLSPSHNKRTVKRSCKLLGTSVLGVDESSGRACPVARAPNSVMLWLVGL